MSAWATGAWAANAWYGTAWFTGGTTPSEIPQGGAGYPVDWQVKRRKLTLKEQPEKHLRHILDTVVAEYYGEIIEADLPKSVKAEAADVVRPFVEKQARGSRIPNVERVDWEALQRNADAVAALIRLWNEEVSRNAIADDDEEFFMMMN